MKKVLSVVLATIMIFAIIPLTSFAATAPTITATADKTTVKVGDTINVTVSISANSNLTALGYELNFDTSYFQLVDNSVKTYGALSLDMASGKKAGKISYAGAADSPVTGNAKTFLTASFKILKTNGKITCNVTEAYVESDGRDVNVTTACANVSTKNITFSGTSTPSSYDYIEIATPSTTSVRYKDGIILHAEINKTLPNNAKLVWSTDNGNFKTSASEDGKSFTIISDSNGTTKVTLTLYDSTGKTVLDTDNIEMTSKAGFFDIIGGFFRSLFGSTKILSK